MKKFILLTKTWGFKVFSRLVIYILFIYFNLNLYFSSVNSQLKTFIIIILILCSLVLSYYEYLNYIYHQAIINLNHKLNLNCAINYFNILRKDRTKYTKDLLVIGDILVGLSLFKTDQVIELINKNDYQFRGNLDSLMLRNCLLFLAYSYGNQRNKAKNIFKEIQKLKDFKIKNKKIAPLFNYQLLLSIYYYLENNHKKAQREIIGCDTTLMNHRELLEYYYFRYLISLGNQKEDQESLNYLTQYNNDFKYLEKINESRL